MSHSPVLGQRDGLHLDLVIHDETLRRIRPSLRRGPKILPPRAGHVWLDDEIDHPLHPNHGGCTRAELRSLSPMSPIHGDLGRVEWSDWLKDDEYGTERTPSPPHLDRDPLLRLGGGLPDYGPGSPLISLGGDYHDMPEVESEIGSTEAQAPTIGDKYPTPFRDAESLPEWRPYMARQGSGRSLYYGEAFEARKLPGPSAGFGDGL